MLEFSEAVLDLEVELGELITTTWMSRPGFVRING